MREVSWTAWCFFQTGAAMLCLHRKEVFIVGQGTIDQNAAF